jgi:TetR/AcrR family transcriptional repressor of bet genes
LADVADGAGLSRGIVNFHFESKEKLLFSTLEHISKSYAVNWQRELKKVEKDSAAKQLHALVKADLNNKVCTPRLISAWFGFYSEAQSRPNFRALCWARDDDYLSALRDLCETLKREGQYSFDPTKTANAIYAMQEGLWLRLMLASKSLNRASALEIALTTLGTMFPKHFDINGIPTK